jgi:glutamine amidotransferase
MAIKMITIVDYGIGNVASIQNMLHRVGVESLCSSDPHVILKADKLILPGVGAFDAAMDRLNELALPDVIRGYANSGKPLLGICLGAQLLMEGSEEGKREGLGLLRGTCRLFRDIQPLRVPHMSWSEVEIRRPHPLFRQEEIHPRFYFVHSYYMQCADQEDILATAVYGHPFAAAVARQQIWGVQFHPEKSHKFGFSLLRNFAEA